MPIKLLESIVPSYPIVEESEKLISIYLASKLILGEVVTIGYKGRIYNFQNTRYNFQNTSTHSEDSTPFQEEVGVWRFSYPISAFVDIIQVEPMIKFIEKFIYEKGISVGDIYE